MTDILPFNPTGWVNNKIKNLKKTANNFLTGQWTVRDNISKADICEFDTILGYSYESNSDLPSYPLQDGGFNNYNKIASPDKATVTLAISGNKTFLINQLAKLEDYNKSTRLVDLILPFKYFVGFNLCNLSHGLSEGDAISMLIVKFDLIEIKQVVVNFKKVKANYKSTTSTGKTNPQEVKKESFIRGLLKGILG